MKENKEVPWAKEIKAFAEGKDLEYSNGGGIWDSMEPSNPILNPITKPGMLWRVKEKPLFVSWNCFVADQPRFCIYTITTVHLARDAHKHGWDSLAKYLVDNGLIEASDIPSN